VLKDSRELIESSKSLFFLTPAAKQYKLEKENFTMGKAIRITEIKIRQTGALHLQPKSLQ
jgi:hypothetical protein